ISLARMSAQMRSPDTGRHRSATRGQAHPEESVVAAPNLRRTTREHPPIGERLRAERQAHGLSLRDLAERLGVSPSLISQIETGRARPAVNTLYAIANELSVSIDDLLFLDTDRADPE